MDLGRLRSLVGTAAASAEGLDAAATWRAVSSLLANPASNPRVAMVVGSCVVVLVLLVIVTAALFLLPPKRRVVVRRLVPDPPEEEPDAAAPDESAPPRPPSRLLLALTGPAAAGLLAVAAIAGAFAATSTDAYCARTCHAGAEAAVTAGKAAHASCVSCHEDPLPFGFVGSVAARARMALRSVASASPAGAVATVDSRRCLLCHRPVLGRIVTSATGVRVSHAEPNDAGTPCTECHDRAGHTARAYAHAMSGCITCHDGTKAAAECSCCHAKDPVSATFASAESTTTIGSGRTAYPGVRAAGTRCEGCHDVAADCDPCHGVRMPHSAAFVESGHARAAAFSRKTACFKCHTLTDCGGCHSAPFDPRTGLGGHADWEQGHRTASWDSGCACHEARTRRRSPMCALCHDPKTHALLPVVE